MSDEVSEAIGLTEAYKAKTSAARKTSVRQKRKSKGKRVSRSEIAKIVELTSKGLSQHQVAKSLQRSQQTVHAVLRDLGLLQLQTEEITQYAAARDIVLTNAEMRVIQSLNDPQKHRAASLRDCAYAFKELYQAGRLEKGLSTSNSQQLRFTVTTTELEMQAPSIIEVSTTDNTPYENLASPPPSVAEGKEEGIPSQETEQGGGG